LLGRDNPYEHIYIFKQWVDTGKFMYDESGRIFAGTVHMNDRAIFGEVFSA
jgi:hypothetical protein